MKRKTVFSTLAAFLIGFAVCLAAEANMGTWKLNEAKSKLNPAATKNHTVMYEAAGDNIRVTVDGTAADGKPVHSVWTGKFDGKDYPVTGDPAGDARWYKRVDANTLDFGGKMAGKEMVTGRISVSADGKSRTVTTTTTDASGKKTTGTGVYDKQ